MDQVKFFKGRLSQILLGPLLNTLSHLFSYALVVLMSHNKELKISINRIHERGLKTLYNNFESLIDELLVKDKSFKIHHRNLQKLAFEIFKVTAQPMR